MRKYGRDNYIKLDDIDIDTIERIEFRKDEGEEPCAVVYHVYKHKGTFITEISIEKAEEYLEENDELIHSYSFNGSSVSKNTFYSLLKKEKDSDVSEEDEEETKKMGTVSKTEAEKKAFADEILKNIHKQQSEEEKGSDSSEEDEEKPKKMGTVSKTDAEKKAFADEILKNIHKQQYEEEMNRYNRETEEKEEKKDEEEIIIDLSSEEDEKNIPAEDTQNDIDEEDAQNDIDAEDAQNDIDEEDAQNDIDEEDTKLYVDVEFPSKIDSEVVRPISVQQEEPKRYSSLLDNPELATLIDNTWGNVKPTAKKEDTIISAKEQVSEPKVKKNNNDLTIRALWNTVGTSPEESSMEDEEVQLFHKIIGSDGEKKVNPSEESKPVEDKTSGKKINGIIIYSAINRENKIVNRAMVIYEGGVIRNVSEEIFTDMIAKEAHQRGYSDYNKLVEEGFVVFTTVNNLVRDWDKYFGDDSRVYPTSTPKKTNEPISIDPKKSNEPRSADTKKTDETIKIDPIQVQRKDEVKKDNKNDKKNTNSNNNSAKPSKPIAPVPINATNKNTANNTKNSNAAANSNTSNNSTNNTNSNTNTKNNTPTPATTSSCKNTKKQGILSRIGCFFKRHIAATVAVITAGIIALTVGLTHKSSKNEKDELNPSQSYSQMDDNNNNSNNNNNTQDVKDKTQALNSLKNVNNLRYEFLDRVGGATEKYNTEFANQYYEAAKGSKLAHSFDETESEYLAYNNFSDEELSVILGNDKLDSKTLAKNFNSAIKVDGQLHNLQTHTVNRDNLFKTQEGRDFYKKYSDLFTSLNKSTVNETKVQKLEKFYDMLREDFDFSTVPSEEESYKLSILEYISAVNNINVNTDIENELTSTEKAYFEKLNDVAETKLQNIATKQNSKSVNVSDANLQVSEYRELVEEYLKSQKAYNLTNRDVSNYDSYKAHTNINVAVKEEEREITTSNTNNNTNNNTDNNNYSNYDNNSYIYDDNSNYSDYTDDEVELIVGDEENTDEVELFIGDEDTNNSESIKIETNDGQSGELVIDTENGTAEIYLDDFVEDEYASSTTTDSKTVYSDGVLNEDGSLSDNYKESSNGEGAVSQDTELPDPNKISDEQLEAMMLAMNGSDEYEAPKVLKL